MDNRVSLGEHVDKQQGNAACWGSSASVSSGCGARRTVVAFHRGGGAKGDF